MKKTIWLIGSAIVMTILILDTQTAINGAHEGMTLCLHSVIPALFPLITVSTFLNSLISCDCSGPPSLVSRVLRIPEVAVSPLIIGSLGGYPTGAQCVSQLYLHGQLPAKTAARLISVCNNCGPAFLFGIAASQFDSKYAPWELWMILLIGNIICISLYPVPFAPSHPSVQQQLTCTQAIKISTKIMVSICGWVIIVRVLIEFLTRWFLWRMASFWQVLIYGTLELTNGVVRLIEIENSTLRFILCIFLLSFGGCCVTLQTFSVVHPEIDRRKYFPGKLIYCLICILLAALYQFCKNGHETLCLVISAVFYVLLLRRQKKSSILHPHRI